MTLFRGTAERFVEQVQGCDFGPGTEVYVILHFVDEAGRDLPPYRLDVMPAVSVSVGVYGKAFAEQVAAKMCRDGVCQNILSLVGPIPHDRPHQFRGMGRAGICKQATLEIQNAG